FSPTLRSPLSLHDALPISAIKTFNATAGGTNLVDNLTIVNEKLFFSVSRNFDTESDELWISDGTTTGTLPVKAFGWLPPDESTAMKKDRKSTRLNSSHVKISYA